MTFKIILLASGCLLFLLVAVLCFYFWKKPKVKTIPAADIPESQFLTETGELEELAVLEEIPGGGGFLFWQPFAASSGNPDYLPGVEYEVIYERNGIHYINDDAFIIDRNTEGKLDNDFVKLVESVVANV